MENKIKEINWELIFKHYSFVNSDRRDWLIDFFEENRKFYARTKWDLSNLYVNIVIKDFKVNKSITEKELSIINKKIKEEIEKEGRCKVKIKEEYLASTNKFKMYKYIILESNSILDACVSWNIKNE